tara:strand:+ start:107 stop:574 length:468 start_codon:yes stop_codon:yes gene_type:complete
MKETLTLELLEKTEVEEFLNIAIDSFTDKKQGLATLKRQLDLFFEKGNLLNGLFYSFKSNSEIIGTIYIKERECDLDGVDIFNVVIKKDTRGEGIGKKMLQSMFEMIKKTDKEFAFVSTDKTDENFYKKCGMKEFGRINESRNNADRVYLYKRIA